MITIVTIVDALPPELFAITVYAEEALISVGVPDIAPVDVENKRPAGSCGLIDQDTTAPPLEVGVAVDMSDPFDKLNELGE